ncbi:2-dehydropantoate 2-reductase [Marinobacter sp.]|uniref:2-dehydropantoate 2-reductase n=1 Tax=Marinobacter sp. TaxID=50741 RepID=UPI00384C6F69
MPDTYRIVIFGAGNVGCYIGGRLLSAGADVTMIGRDRLKDTLAANPLVVTDYHGFESSTQVEGSQFTTDANAARDADLVLVTTKSGGTEEAGKALARVLEKNTPVVSLQNGVSNPDILRKHLPEANVLAGTVPFNVIERNPGHFHQGTEGHLMAEESPAMDEALGWFRRAGLPLELRADMTSVQWSKLLLNLNNPINALSGLPLQEELAQRDYRRCLALAQQETLTLMEWAGIRPVKLTSIPMQLVPYIMKAPDWLFTRLAKRMLVIDPVARSSMWNDIEAGRPTEVDWLNGEVVRLATSLKTRAPVNQTLTHLIHQCELEPNQKWPASELLNHLQGALDDYHAGRR